MGSKGPTIPDQFPREQAYISVHDDVPQVIGFPGYEVRLVPSDDPVLPRKYRLISTPGQHDVNEHFAPSPEEIVRHILDARGVPKPAETLRNRAQFARYMLDAIAMARGESTQVDHGIEYLYEYANQIKAGDILPDVSRFPVSDVTYTEGARLRVCFEGTEFRKFFDCDDRYGWAAVRIERAL